MRLSMSLLSVLLFACATTQSTAPDANHAPPATPDTRDATASTAEPNSATDAPLAVIDIANAAQPLPGVVTGGQPSDAQLREAKTAGYHTVISLLPEADTAGEAALAAELGLRFVTIEVRGAQDLNEDKARALGTELRATGAKPLILHCASGNRAGALLALESFYVEHASPEEALALGDRAGLKSLRPTVAALLGAAAAPSP